MEKLILFDLDGTIADSKSPLDAEMAACGCATQRFRGVQIEDRGSQVAFSDGDALFPGGNDYPATEAKP